MNTFFLSIGAFMVGALPTKALVLSMWGVDLNAIGTGNAGAGNASRSIGLRAGVLVAVLDGLKGLVPVLIGRSLGLSMGALAFVGLASVAGNNWPVHLHRRGGRGLATSVGVVVGFQPLLIWWPALWSVLGWRIGGSIAGFIGWGLLPIVVLTAHASEATIGLAFGLAVMMAVRRAQGNSGYAHELALGRVLFDDDRVVALPHMHDAPAGARRLRMMWFGAVVLAAYTCVTWWAMSGDRVREIGLVGLALISLGVACEFGAKWTFGELFRDGVRRGGGELGGGSAFRAALVGAGVARLIPAGGAVTPLAMAWSVRNEAPSASGAALRATVLNYGGLLIGAGGGLLWVTSRFDVPRARGQVALMGAVMLVLGAAMLVGSARLTLLTRLAPRRWRARLEQALVDHSVDTRTLLLLASRVVLEAAALGLTLWAFGIELSPSRTIAAFAVSQLVGGLPGTPGGLGFTEAGLVGSLAFFGVPAATGLGPVLVFRVISYWLPALAGAFAGGSSFLRARSIDEHRV